MENNIAEMLDAEIERTLTAIKTAKTGTDEAKGMLIKLDKLHAERMKELEANLKERQLMDASLAKIDESKIRKAELEQRVKQAEADAELRKAELIQKEAELKEAKKGRIWRTVLDILGIGVPTAVSGYWMYKGLKFEEEGKIYSSRTSQWVSNLTRLFRKG